MAITYGRRQGLLVEPVGDVWVAFSPVCGETVLLNDASAAILEVLEDGPASTLTACERLARETGDTPGDLVTTVEQSWSMLIQSGLVESLPGPSTP